MPLRILRPLALAALALAGSPPVARTATRTLPIVHRGGIATIGVATPSGPVCIAALMYADGGESVGGIKRTQIGRLSWTVRVPTTAALGRATWSVRCGVTFELTRAVLVVRA